MGDLAKFPQKQVSDYTSLMTLLSCDDCHMRWIGMYDTGVTIDDLYCPYCDGQELTNRQGEREIYFYEYSGECNEIPK